MSVRDPLTGQPIAQKKQPGYYPNYHTLSQRKYWDATTRELVEKRVDETPPIRFFTPEELAQMTAVCEHVLPQDDRLPEWRIPIVNKIDERLYDDTIDGYRFDDMPPDREAYRQGLKAINQTARVMFDQDFVDLRPLHKDQVLKSIHDGKKLAGDKAWHGMSIKRFWQLLVTDCVKVYYAHPWAWDEIGFGGPAYPRAYTRLEGGLPEPWEVDEVRYEWVAPAESISDELAPPQEAGEGESHVGQGGTH